VILPIRAQGDPYQQHQGQEFAGPKVCFSSGTGNRRCWDSLDFDTGPPPASCSSHVYIPPSRILPLRPCRHGLGLVSHVGASRKQTPPLPVGNPAPTYPTPCSLAAFSVSLQPAALRLQPCRLQLRALAMGSGVVCFRKAYYEIYPVSTEDLIISRGWVLGTETSNWSFP
jgi:hypothetical protein